MSDLYYEVKDRCRRNLIGYTLNAFRSFPAMDKPLILDLGCGTGASTLALLGACDGQAYAIDTDEKSLAYFRRKAELQGMSDRIRIMNDSVFHANQLGIPFDLIIAEGILNVVGFEKGLEIIISLLKSGGYTIIHDELKRDKEKRNMFRKNNLKLLYSFELIETVWWNEYYGCLEKPIESAHDKELFRNEIEEIAEYRKDPQKFRSIVYGLEKV